MTLRKESAERQLSDEMLQQRLNLLRDANARCNAGEIDFATRVRIHQLLIPDIGTLAPLPEHNEEMRKSHDWNGIAETGYQGHRARDPHY